MTTTGPCWSVLLALALTAAPTQAEERRTLAVLALKADTEFPAGMDDTLNEILLGELSRYEALEVIGASDVRSMLQHEEQKALLGRCTEEDCLAQIGTALCWSTWWVPTTICAR